jgi:hypothetical protein
LRWAAHWPKTHFKVKMRIAGSYPPPSCGALSRLPDVVAWMFVPTKKVALRGGARTCRRWSDALRWQVAIRPARRFGGGDEMVRIGLSTKSTLRVSSRQRRHDRHIRTRTVSLVFSGTLS